MTYYYSGIGPRKTPTEVCEVMTKLSASMGKDWCLRSGGASGADVAFEKGTNNCEIYLPYDGFNGHYQDGKTMGVYQANARAIEIAIQNHTHWHFVSTDQFPYLFRNVPIILGENLDEPSKMVVTWFPAKYTGGTTHAVQIAKSFQIPVFNIYLEEDQIKLCEFIEKIENQTQGSIIL